MYVWFSDLYHCQKKFLVPQPIYTHRKIIKTPLLHQSLGPHVFFFFFFPMYFSFVLSLSLSFSLSLSPRLIIWSAEIRRIHPPAWASKTPSRRHPVPSPPQEGSLCLCERCKPCVKSFIGSLHKPGNISLFLSFTFLLSTQTTMFQSIKGPQQVTS